MRRSCCLCGRSRWADLLPASGDAATSWRRIGPVELETPPATALGPTGPDVLVSAAVLLPEVVGAAPVCTDSVHAAAFEALCRLGAGQDRYHRLRLADETSDLFAAFLVALGLAPPAARTSDTLRGWVTYRNTAAVQVALAVAAGYWRAALMGRWSAPWRAGSGATGG